MRLGTVSARALSGAGGLARGRQLIRVLTSGTTTTSSTSRHTIMSSAAAAASPPSPSPSPSPSAPTPTHDQLMSALDDLVPPLTRTNHKGQHGKVGVVGGCLEYTGAPYFAAMSAIKVGADLAHIFCTPAAAGPLKTYSPELIVLPYLPEGEEAHLAGAAEEIQACAVALSAQRVGAWLPRLTCLIIGPGLGDDPGVVEASRAVLLEARHQGLPLIIDGSGLNFVAKEPSLVAGCRNAILTPNLPEFGRLAAGAGVALPGEIGPQWQQHTAELARALGGVTVVAKGPTDVISDGDVTLVCDLPASLRRAGGQGDVLAGATAAFTCWARLRARTQPDAPPLPGNLPPTVLSAYAGSALMRRASDAAFKQHGRSMLAGDVITHLPAAFARCFPGH